MSTTKALAVSLSLLSVPAHAQTQSNPSDDSEAERNSAETARLVALEKRIIQLELEAATRESETEALEDRTTAARAPVDDPSIGQDQEPSAQARKNAMDRYIRDEFEDNTESRSQKTVDQPHYAEKLEEVLNGYVDLAGYFRAGYGRNDRGGPQTDFQAPGALAKYRLGNEANNFGEIIFGKNIYVPGIFSANSELRPSEVPEGPIARIQFRAEFFNTYSDTSVGSNTSVALPEAWASIGNVFESQPSAKFWAGNRFYRRQDVHLNDFFFWNMSGGGAGIEDIGIGRAKFAFAWIGVGSTSGVSDVPAPDPLNEAGFSKTNLDLRIYDWSILAGDAEIGVIYSRARSGLDENGEQANSSSGVSFNFVHKIPHFISEDGQQRFALQVGNGAAKTFNSTFERITTTQGEFIRPDDAASWRLRVIDDFSANLGEHFSLGPVLVYQLTDFADGAGRHEWFSAGLRPIVHFNRFLNIAVEGGIDWVKDPSLDSEGTLYKLTVAPQVSLGNRFFSRPTVRAYATWAHWTDDFVGQVGGSDHFNRNGGFNAGAQMEAWF
jgi:maltoporin